METNERAEMEKKKKSERKKEDNKKEGNFSIRKQTWQCTNTTYLSHLPRAEHKVGFLISGLLSKRDATEKQFSIVKCLMTLFPNTLLFSR